MNNTFIGRTNLQIIQHQLEGGTNPLIYRNQPRGRTNSLSSLHQLEGGYDPLIYRHQPEGITNSLIYPVQTKRRL
jgi:hypothetical protein